MNRGGCEPFVRLIDGIILLINYLILFIMNKKFSTLMAAALLAGSFPVVAQNAHPNGLMGNANGEIPYRSQFVKSASLDQGLFGVKNIESDKWYQLTVNMTMRLLLNPLLMC